MEIVIDFSAIPQNDPVAAAWWFFSTIGWIIPVILFIQSLLWGWQNHLRNQFRKTRKYILLAIDIPKDNEQTPKAVENIFSHLAAIQTSPNFYEKWWTGELPDSFSFEIVSLGGYIQFIIHLEETHRDLVEAAIYAQYPNAEITEIEDYTKDWNIKFPNDKYDLFGTELKLANKEVYPLITYKEFEDTLIGELKDPMASMLEALTRIGPGEQIWIQLILTPAPNDWGDRAKPVIDKIIGAKSGGGSKGIFAPLAGWVSEFDKQITGSPEGSSDSGAKKDEPNKMQYLTAGEKDTVSAIEHKISKIGFYTRIRYIYLAEKDKFVKARGDKGVFGAFKQFNDLGLNSFKSDSKIKTGGMIFLKKQRVASRQRRILYRYKHRGDFLDLDNYGFILNTEELASIWHFPILTVKAPLVKKTEAKRSEPPMSLPVENVQNIQTRPEAPKGQPPTNLPK